MRLFLIPTFMCVRVCVCVCVYTYVRQDRMLLVLLGLLFVTIIPPNEEVE